MKKVISTLGEKVLEKLFDFDKNNLDFDCSCLYGESDYCTCNVEIEVGKTSVSCMVCYKDEKFDFCEVEVYREGHNYENVQAELQKYMDENFDEVEMYTLIEDEMRCRVPYDEPCGPSYTHANTGVGYRLCG